MSAEPRMVTIPLFWSGSRSSDEHTKEHKNRRPSSSQSRCCCTLPLLVILLVLTNVAWIFYTYRLHPTLQCEPTSQDSLVSQGNAYETDDSLLSDSASLYEIKEESSVDEQEQSVEDVNVVKDVEDVEAPPKDPDAEAKMDVMMRYLFRYYRETVSKPVTLGSINDRIPPLADRNSVYWRFSLQISNYGLYLPQSTDNGKLIDELLDSMAYSPVEFLESVSDKGTELKLFARFKDGTEAVMKPQRMERDEDVGVNIWYNAERERHYAEIAAFHLDRLLGLARVPPCVGRQFNITSEIVPYVDDTLLWSLHTSPGGNLCYYGKCRYLCDLFHPVCGKPDVIEYSVCVFIPRENWPTKNQYSPWRRSYNYHYLATWQEAENNDTYCAKSVLTDETYAYGRTLLDLVDCLVFDFLTGNEDRHSYNRFLDFLNISTLINYDNGRAFGRPYRDVMDSLAPLYQCCMLRASTYHKLKFIRDNQHGIKLSDLMRYSLSKDPLTKNAPILTDRHLLALDRRLEIIFEVIERDCLQKKKLTLEKVLIDDTF